MPAVCKNCDNRGILKRPKTVRNIETLFVRLKVILNSDYSSNHVEILLGFQFMCFTTLVSKTNLST